MGRIAPFHQNFPLFPSKRNFHLNFPAVSFISVHHRYSNAEKERQREKDECSDEEKDSEEVQNQRLQYQTRSPRRDPLIRYSIRTHRTRRSHRARPRTA